MPVPKICPLFLIFFKNKNITCIQERCELWLDSGQYCIFVSYSHTLKYIGDSLQTLIDILSTRLSEKI